MSPRRAARLTLRARLLVTMLLLLALGSAVVAVSAEFVLQHYLQSRLDAQLMAAGNRSIGSPEGGRGQPAGADGGPGPGAAVDGRDGGGPQFLLAPGQAEGTLGVRIVSGTATTAGVLTATGSLRPLSLPDARAVATVSADGHTHTLDLPDIGDYRLLAQRAADGDVFVTGLPLRDVHATLLQLGIGEAVVAALVLVAAGTAGGLVLRRTLAPLGRVAAVATAVSDLPLGRGEVALAQRVPERDVDARTEVGQVGAALNRLLASVDAALSARQASETRVRQFVADASHELRTPLAAIRGYAELPRRSREPLPAVVTHALSRVESEAVRMTALVEDLLLLARLDAGRPLARDEVDLSQLLVDAAGDAHMAGPDHPIALELPPEPVVVPGDALRLHQVVANLLANARTHTPPGTSIRVRLDPPAQGSVLVTVTDDGPGVAPEMRESLFERFARGDTSRSRAAGSTGLGLAIVDAVVSAHGGSVSVSSRPGRTAFSVRLPAAQWPNPRPARTARPAGGPPPTARPGA